ncbi:MAG TPA: hypothetical protein VGM88_03960 [Kofleriaceae bacterium]|jgi:hypothetical protein
MALLKAALAVLLLAGCYDPTLKDCVVTCANPGDCADGQVCGADKFCAAPDVAGTCSPAEKVALHVTVMGMGQVEADNIGTCSSEGSQNGNCTWMVTMGEAVELHAMTVSSGHAFLRWTMPITCLTNTDCSVTPTQSTTTVSAMFQ